ncbi:MAG: hypothetical protein AB8B73_10800 [Ekhidna sp.]
MKKVIVLSLILLTGIPISCDATGGNGSGFLRIESFALTVGLFKESENPNSFSPKIFDPAPFDTLSYADLAIELRVNETSFIASAQPHSLISSAFADPAPPRLESKISLISIYAQQSVYAGGVEYEAGENLTNLFLISSRYSESTTVLNFIKDEQGLYLYESVYMILNTPLDEPFEQSLLIDITLEDGRVFNLESPKIVVK